ncbi:trehalose 6-phosphate phosphatase [Okibacterium sp. HSC-33S16]|uniref:trehalose-phosphatase n=1 Tax=Okibacterium sp. HSC-33S16 TaxID=2910965 RepID=UPI00209F2C23|nr:trehalose-phosphatase [Okibacterium sp. HSC-33S16]MCP2030486.1 trehalose 6-phosphate phosphatase [Okibacterium sp. HSC-33S16]
MTAIPAELEAALTGLAETEHLLVALDFDGTLAPFVDNPDDSRAIPEARQAVAALLEVSHTTVAYVSGRAIDSLQRVAGSADGILLVGSHGAEYRFDGVDTHPPLSEDERARVHTLSTALSSVSSAHPGTWVEAKPAGFALHTRGLSAEKERLAADAARDAVTKTRLPVTVRDGKDVLEFSILSVTKGDAIRHLRDYTGATAVLYAGDDVTDEDGFAALGAGDLALKCGEGETGAKYRVASPSEVAAVLARLAEDRAATGR